MTELQNKKLEDLKAILKKYAPLAVAFSGGVDSTFLLKVASDTLGTDAIAITVEAPYIATWEIEEADELTAEMGIVHDHLSFGVADSVALNPENRCYLCKTAVFSNIIAHARSKGYTTVVDGTNADDLGDYRPGLKALQELQVKSPLLEAGMTKADIRQISKDLRLKTWDKPPYACLLTRLPYNTPVEIDVLRRIEKAEKSLMDMGIRGVRVRTHGNIARIEVSADEMHKILIPERMAEIHTALKAFGYEFVTLDLGGYKMGSFNGDLQTAKV